MKKTKFVELIGIILFSAFYSLPSYKQISSFIKFNKSETKRKTSLLIWRKRIIILV